MATLTSRQGCSEVRFLKSLLHFSKFLVNANFDLITEYILRKKNKQHFHWCIIVRAEIL